MSTYNSPSVEYLPYCDPLFEIHDFFLSHGSAPVSVPPFSIEWIAVSIEILMVL